MTAADDLRAMLIRLGGPLQHSDTKESWLRRAARIAGISERQARKYYYREAKRVDADTYLRLQAQINALEQTIRNRGATIDVLETVLRAPRHPMGEVLELSRVSRDAGGSDSSAEGGAPADKRTR